MSDLSDSAPEPSTSAASEPSAASKWLVAVAVMLGTFLSVMDATVVNVAMPHMMGAFGVNLLTITWVSTAYSIAEIIIITMAAWLSTVIGRKRLFLASMGLFITGSVLAGTSQTFGEMLVFRVMQGAGGGTLIPVSQAILRETFPPAEQGMAMAVYAMGVVLAPAIGPVLGGWLIQTYSWRWVFYINVPFCIGGIAMVSAFVHDPTYLKRGVKRIDWGGILLLTIGLTASQIVLERGEQADWFASHWIVLGTIVAVVALVGLVVWELYQGDPIIDFKLLRNIPLSVGSGMGMLIGFALYGSSFLLPQFTQNLLGYPALEAGLVLMPRALVMLSVMPIIGRIYNVVSPRVTVGVGLVGLSVAYWWLSHFSLGVSFWSFLPILVLTGASMGAAMVTLSTVTLSQIDRRNMTSASSIYTLARREAGNVAYALLATIVARRTQYHRSVLAHNISSLNPIYRHTRSGIVNYLKYRWLDSDPSHKQAVAMITDMVNRQSRMMAYNNAFFIMVPMFFLILPFVLLLPKHGYKPQPPSSTDH